MSKKGISTANLTDVDIYKLVLEKKLIRFPKYFWEKPGAFQSAKEITIYLLECVLKWADDDIKSNFNQKTFIEHKLTGMLGTLFGNSPYKALNNAYPDKYKPWELNITMNHFWNECTAYEFVKWIIEEKYKMSDEEIKENFSKTWIVTMGFDCAMDCIKEDTFGIINKIYPGKFKPWELKQVAIDYWNKKTMGEALRWLIEEKLSLNPDKDNIKISYEFLYYNGLGRLADYIQKHKISIYELVNMAYPNKYKEWEITNLDLWTEDKIAGAVKWLAEEKLNQDPNTEIKVKAKDFHTYGLSGLLTSCDNSPSKAINIAYRK